LKIILRIDVDEKKGEQGREESRRVILRFIWIPLRISHLLTSNKFDGMRRG